MRKFGLIGHPLGHSLSPQIHTRLFELSGETVDYRLYDIAPEELSQKYEFLASLDGFNITIPHKVGIIDYCDKLSEGAQRYRSVNCVSNGSEKLGFNTDVNGFTMSIDMLGARLDSDVLLIGCGGVGRMIAIETAISGGRLTISVLRSDEALARQAADEIKAQKPDAQVNIILTDGLLEAGCFEGGAGKFDLLINASPIGMFPKTDRMPCTPDILDNVDFVFDVVYNPCVTLLAKTAREKGKKAMTGMAMLVLQAVAAHKIWDNASYSEEDIDKLIRDMEALV